MCSHTFLFFFLHEECGRHLNFQKLFKDSKILYKSLETIAKRKLNGRGELDSWMMMNGICINHHMKNEEKQCNQDRMDLQNHSNANTEKLCQSQEYSLCPLHTHSQTFS